MRRITYSFITLLLIQLLVLHGQAKNIRTEFNQASREFVFLLGSGSSSAVAGLDSQRIGLEGIKDGFDFQTPFKSWDYSFKSLQLKKKFFSIQKVVFHNAYDYVFSGINPPLIRI